MYMTYYGANSWLLQFDNLHILIDPWLVGSLSFANINWFFKGDHTQPVSIPEKVDLIMLSQGLEDHAHRPTLKQLNRQIPVIASPSGAKVAKSLSYTDVISLTPGESYSFREEIVIYALSGAPIGFQVENGYWIKHIPSDITLYYEPHGFPSPHLDKLEATDIVISPTVNLELPLVGAIIQGRKTAIKIANLLRPEIFFSTALGDNVTYTGILDKLLKIVGNSGKFQEQLVTSGLQTQHIEAPTGLPIEVLLKRKLREKN